MMNKREFSKSKTFETTLGGRPLTVETGKLAELANGACMIRYGETVVLVAATASEKPREGIDFFPLSVDFEERLYSVGRIPGSFLRREGRASEKGTLASRLIDRPIRPLFPSDLRNDVVILAMVMSVDPDNPPEIAAMIGTSIALSISNIPWAGPIGGVNIAHLNGEFIINPTSAQREESPMFVTVAATDKKVVMIEAACDQVSEDLMFDGIMHAHEEIKKLVAFINNIVAEIGVPKFTYEQKTIDLALYDAIEKYGIDKLRHCLDTDDKNIREERLAQFRNELTEKFGPEFPDINSTLGDVLYKMQKYVVRRWLLDDGKRVDGRAMDEVRPLAAEVGILPRTHGSGLFTRGQTQVLTIATLGTISAAQKLDTIYEEESKRYMHHYNFPSFSVGEARGVRGPGRREIGHGALAEKALEPVIPSLADFPYAIRLVSEVLSSNGSTSQGAICGSTLALMDAGVPIKAPVAGISCGLVTEGERWMTFIDIQGVEDFHGDMDFKVGGTKKGITAIQMDLKNDGLTPDIIRSALTTTRDARYKILDDIMLPCIPEPRAELSKYAPKMIIMKIDVDKIREVIGQGGKVIQKIVADTNTKIDIEDDGSIFIASENIDDCRRAQKIIESIIFVPKIGDIFHGTVTRLMTFGAFVEFAPGKEGMVHISKLAPQRVGKVEDVVNIGDKAWVKIVEIDEKGRINLSRKDAMTEIEKNGPPAN